MIQISYRKKLDFKYPFSNCLECPIYPGSQSKIKNNNWGVFDQEVKYIFISDKGSDFEWLFDGESELLFQQILIDLKIKDFFITSLTKCRPFDGKKGDNFKTASNCCSDNLTTLIQIIAETNKQLNFNPPKIIMLGKSVAEYFFPEKVSKKSTASSLRNQVYALETFPNIKFYFTFHPTVGLYNQEYLQIIKNDLLTISIDEDSKPEINSNYVLIETLEQFDSLIEILNDSDVISYDIETSNTKYVTMRRISEKKRKGIKIRTEDWDKGQIIGISFSNERGSGVYLPLFIKAKHFTDQRAEYVEEISKKFEGDYFTITENSTQDDFFFWFGNFYVEYVIQNLKSILENKNIKKIAQNGKFDNQFLEAQFNIKVQNFYFDTMLASFLINENTPHSLEFMTDTRYPDLSGYKQKVFNRLTKEQIDSESYSDLPLENIYQYGARDADATLRLFFDLSKELIPKKEKNKYSFYNPEFMLYNLYMPLQRRYSQSEMVGILYDRKYAQDISEKFKLDIKTIQAYVDNLLIQNQIPKLNDSDERMINLNSSPQKRKLFFDYLNWPIFKETKTVKDQRKYQKGDEIESEDASTDRDVLKQLLEYFHNDNPDKFKLEIELIESILEFSKKNKMISTYLEGKTLQSRLDENDFLHYSMKLHGTVSGRLSCIDSNTLIETEVGKIKVSKLLKDFQKQSQESFYILTHNNTYKKLLNIFTKGIEEMVEIELENGRKLKCTLDHKLLTNKGWIKVREIMNTDCEVLTYGD